MTLKKLRFGVVIFPGSNCDRDCLKALSLLNIDAVPIWHKESELKNINAVVLPGGFSYGDYLRPGIIARFSEIMKPIIDFANQGGLVIGICNGFQILTESGLLPGALLKNQSLKFICKYVTLKCERASTPFTLTCQNKLRLPIAHGEGRYYADSATLLELENNSQIIFRYSPDDDLIARHENPKTQRDAVSDAEAVSNCNPNGSVNNIAGIINKNGNVLGLMPHPERAYHKLYGSNDGNSIFQSMIKFLENRI